MRTIKFRGKVKNPKTKKGEWVYGHYYEEKGKHYIIEENKYPFLVDKNTVGQFTGIVLRGEEDKREVYEGDIVVHCDSDSPLSVEYKEEEACFVARKEANVGDYELLNEYDFTIITKEEDDV